MKAEGEKCGYNNKDITFGVYGISLSAKPTIFWSWDIIQNKTPALVVIFVCNCNLKFHVLLVLMRNKGQNKFCAQTQRFYIWKHNRGDFQWNQL